MNQEYNVLAPGPVNLHPKVRESLALPMIHHRTPEFDQILKRTLLGLKKVFQTNQDCYVLTSTGSGGMECLLVNTLAPGEAVLGIDSGKFGERWCDMVEVYGGKLIRHKVPWGESCKVDEIETLLRQNPQIKIVMTQACETSTGALHPIEAIGKMLHQKFPQVLFLVDGITALGALPLKMDDWHLDGLVGGSQKAFMLPTGLSLLCFSEKAWKKIESNPTPRFYFDIRKEKAANQKGETFFSSNVTLVRALDVVLQLIDQKGLQFLFEQIDLRAQTTRAFAKALGLQVYPRHPSPSLTVLQVPPNIDSQKLRTKIETEEHITLMGGQDQLKGKVIRVGHMGYITKLSQRKLFEVLIKNLRSLAPGSIDDDKATAALLSADSFLARWVDP